MKNSERQGDTKKSRISDILVAKPRLSMHPRHGVITLYGFGIRVCVHRGHLILEDGIGADRRYARLPRVGHELKRLVVIGSDGMVSLAALRWLTDQNAAFVMLERDGKVLTTAGPVRTPESRVRRTQALALQSGVALSIARELITQKLAGQEHVARNRLRNPTAADAIVHFRLALSSAETLDAIRFIESQAGAAYWSAWRELPIAFPKKDIPRVPKHWLSFQSRNSPLSGKSARLATNPPNAMLNYLYAVLEAEASLAATAMGLDPNLGFLHSDVARRDSLALDLMEPVRPQVDGFVFDWVSREVLKRDWFFEESNGNCRLMAELAKRLSETADTWRRALAPVAESVNRSLWSSQQNRDGKPGPATHLTQQHRREANRAESAAINTRRIPKPQSVCRMCGVPIAPGRRYCAACGVIYSTANIRKAGKRSHSPEAQARRAETARRNALARWHWDPSTQPAWLTQEYYVNKILPLLARAPVAAIASAIGVTRNTAIHMRTGARIPHPRHWVKLAELTGYVSHPMMPNRIEGTPDDAPDPDSRSLQRK